MASSVTYSEIRQHFFNSACHNSAIIGATVISCHNSAIPRLLDMAMQLELYGYIKIVRYGYAIANWSYGYTKIGRYGYAIGATAITRLLETAMQLELRL